MTYAPVKFNAQFNVKASNNGHANFASVAVVYNSNMSRHVMYWHVMSASLADLRQRWAAAVGQVKDRRDHEKDNRDIEDHLCNFDRAASNAAKA